jgi:hypothetical protein
MLLDAALLILLLSPSMYLLFIFILGWRFCCG